MGPRGLALFTVIGLFALGCDDDGNVGRADAGSGPVADAQSADGMSPDQGGTGERGCDPLAPSYCGFPYPNDYWTVTDSTTPTGLRLALPSEIMPVNRSGERTDPAPFNEMDGFSAALAAMTHMPGATVAGLPTPATIEASLALDSPTVILDAETGERLPHWVDLDAYVVEAKRRIEQGEDEPDFSISRPLAALEQERALMLRPAVRPEDGRRYIVAIRRVRDARGDPLAPSPAFQSLRDETVTDDAALEARREHFEEIFSTLESAGIQRDDLQLAWDFTTASRENNTGAMVAIRDDALARFPDGVPYEIEVKDEDVREGIACRLEISFEMPLYVTQGGAGALLNLDDDGLPEQNGSFTYNAALVVPTSAQSVPAPLVQYGHGQLGAKEQVLGFQEVAAELNLAAFALDWVGFARDDVTLIVRTFFTSDMARFRAIPERMHQGFLNFLLAMRTLSRAADGGPSTVLNQRLASACGGAQIDGSKRYYFGGSQGGILGASIMALTTDIERGVLAVPGQPYNLLLQRSVNFDVYAPVLALGYDWNALHVQLALALIQGLWDRAEPTGYSKYIRTDRLPGTPAHEVLIQVSKSDHQVTNLGAHLMARTIGGVVNLAPVIRPVWGISTVSGPHTGSAMIEVDFGNPDPPPTNVPPWEDVVKDPHGRAFELDVLGPTLLKFFEDGVIENLCSGPCDQDDLAD
jgi:hypothetical protein